MSARSAVRAVVVSALALATIPVLASGAAQAAVCSVTDVQTSGTFTDLQAAINAANPGDTLDVTGHCTGNFIVNKDLTLQGEGSAVLDGGGTGTTIDIGSGNVSLHALTVTGGVSTVGGGVLVNNSASQITLTGVTVNGNSASGDTFASGGGIYVAAGTLTVVDSTVSGNSATVTSTSGGGDFVSGGGVTNLGSVTLINSTISGNTVSGPAGVPGTTEGGGIDGAFSATASILSGNTMSGLTSGRGPDCDAPITSGGYNLIGNTSGCGPGFVATDHNVNPKLDSLKNNGGPTQTMGLLPGSPAIGAIPLSAGACVAGSATDQRGVARPQGKGCDIGAVEKGLTLTTAGSSPNPAGIGQAISFTATVCANPSTLPATPTGTVTFRDGGGGPVLGSSVGLAPGGGTHCAQAQLPFSGFGTKGKHNIVAIYSGDGVNIKSRGSVIQRVRS
jgi:Bacterial Ig-like domain (group 3)